MRGRSSIVSPAKSHSCRPSRMRPKQKAYFERALAVARKQQAKSWELRVAMSMARLWRDQGKRQQARESSRSGLWLVHRRFRHARSEGGQDAARRAARLINASKTPAFQTDAFEQARRPHSRPSAARPHAGGGRKFTSQVAEIATTSVGSARL